MNSERLLHNLSITELASNSDDLLVVAHGFESRGTAIAREIGEQSKRRIAFGFDHNRVAAFEENGRWFKKNGFVTVPDLSRKAFSDSLESVFRELFDSEDIAAINSTARIAVDISCFDRQRIAEIVGVLRRCSLSHNFSTDFWYCVAAFEPPAPSVGRNEIAGPVHRLFAGRFTDPGRPLAMIAGLGYEIGKVMGAAEYLQASRVIALFPESPIPEYEPQVARANKLLVDDLAARDIIRYPLSDLKRTIATLDSIVRGLEDTHNIVLLPEGPKAFFLASLLVQTLHPQASVWRVSSGSAIRPRDVHASSHFVGLRWQL